MPLKLDTAGLHASVKARDWKGVCRKAPPQALVRGCHAIESDPAYTPEEVQKAIGLREDFMRVVVSGEFRAAHELEGLYLETAAENELLKASLAQSPAPHPASLDPKVRELILKLGIESPVMEELFGRIVPFITSSDGKLEKVLGAANELVKRVLDLHTGGSDAGLFVNFYLRIIDEFHQKRGFAPAVVFDVAKGVLQAIEGGATADHCENILNYEYMRQSQIKSAPQGPEKWKKEHKDVLKKKAEECSIAIDPVTFAPVYGPGFEAEKLDHRRYFEAINHVEGGRIKEAIDSAEAIRDLVCKFNAFFQIARLLGKGGGRAAAKSCYLNYCAEIARLLPDTAERLVTMAKDLIEIEARPEARSVLEEARKLHMQGKNPANDKLDEIGALLLEAGTDKDKVIHVLAKGAPDKMEKIKQDFPQVYAKLGAPLDP